MRRRSFLGLAAVGAAASTLSFRPPTPDPERLRRALARAAELGKPMLALLVDDDLETNRESGRLFGRFLLHAEDSDLAVLAVCEVTCVPRADVEGLEDVRRLPGDALAALIETDDSSPRVGAIRRRKSPDLGHDPHGIAPQLRNLLYADDEESARRVQWNRQSIGNWNVLGIDFQDPGARVRLSAVDRAAPVLYQRAQMVPNESELWLQRLAYAAAARLWDEAPEGAVWGVDPIPAARPDPCPPCGMAVCPEPSRSFLHYFTK